MGHSQFVSQIHWLDDLTDICCTNLKIICSDGDHHGISLVAFVSAFKFLEEDLCDMMNDNLDLFISSDLSHDLIEQLCYFVGTGTIYVSDINLKNSIESVLNSLGFSFSLTVSSDNNEIIKQEIIFANEDEIVKQESTFENGESIEGKIELKKDDYMDVSYFEMKELPDDKIPECRIDVPSKKRRKHKSSRMNKKLNPKVTSVISKNERKNSISVINKCREKPGLKAHPSKANLITCEICGMVLTGWFKASLHLSTHIGIQALQCGICEKVLDNQLKYNRHIYNGHRQKITCEICGLVCNSRGLKLHIRNQHSNRKKEHQCEVCKELFMTKGNLKQHMSKHSDERKYSCEYCGMAFKEKCPLKSHIMNVHNKSKLPYTCSECGKGFLSPKLLETHKRTHTGEKPIGCEHCGKMFTNVPLMRSHVKQVHIKQFIFGCRKCSMKFIKKEGFIIHAITHTSLSPFKCSACNSGFRHREAIRRHINKDHPGIDVTFTKPSEEEKKYLESFLVELNDEGEEKD